MKNAWNNFKNIETSKKLLGLLTFLFVLLTGVNYVLNYLIVDISGVSQTYSAVTDLFKLYVVVYAGKAGAENVTKISKGSAK